MGIDRFRITASYESDSGEIISVILMPSPELYISTDADNDGYYAPPAGLDCDDTDPDVNPGADEVCDDGIDNDCDDLIDTADPDCPNGLPAPPSGLTAKARGKSKIALIWQDNSDNEDKFNIYRGTSPSTLLLITTVGANTTSYVDSVLEPKTTYWYKVCAYNPHGDNCSNIVSTTTK